MKSEDQERHFRDMALARAVKVAVPGTGHEEIVKAADAFLEFFKGPPSPLVWFMSRSPEEVVGLLSSYLADRPLVAKDIAYQILHEWVKETPPAKEVADAS